jgi:maltose-binding protein MalE
MNWRIKIFSVVLCMQFTAASQADNLRVVYSYNKTLIDVLIKGFEQEQKIAVQAEHLNVEDMKTGLLSMMELSPPDVIILPSDQVGLYSFANYSEIEPKIFKTKFFEPVLKCGISDGKLYGVPLMQGNHLFLYYNKSLVDTPAQDWQTLRAQKSKFDAQRISTIAWPFNEPYYLLPFISAFGNWPLTDGTIQLNSSAMVDALKFYRETRLVIHSPSCDLGCTETLFKDGKLAYAIGGTWDLKDFAIALGDKLGVNALPKINGKKIVSPFSAYVMAFPNQGLSGEKRAQLIKFVDYLQSPAVQRKLWDQFQAIPVEPSAFVYARENASGYMKTVLELMADTKPISADQEMSSVWNAMSKGMVRYNDGLMEAEATAEYMQQLAERNVRAIKQSQQPAKKLVK